MIKTLEKVFFFLFPLTMLKGTPWEPLWDNQEKKEFQFLVKVFFSITLIGYILHYYAVDKQLDLKPHELWFKYRVSMAGISLFCLLIYSYSSLFEKITYYRIPSILAGAFFCYFQARTIIWYPEVPYLYSFAFILVCVVILRTSILKSTLVALFYLSIIYPTLLEAGLNPIICFSASFFTLAVIIFSRTKYTTDLKFFLATQRNIQQQKKFIEVNLEFTNQIRAFLPSEISKRLTEFIQERRMSVIQAIDEVLRPRNLPVACLFSDIRGFTKGSNDLNGFVSKSMFPNVKESTLSIEKYRGIPRKIGDLIFAYFDLSDPDLSIEMAMRSAIEIAKINSEMNEFQPEALQIKRFILLSFGEAIVGNLSGCESSIEITAIGAPVNYLSRIDELTKNINLKKILKSGDIIISEKMSQQIIRKFPNLHLITIDLQKMGLQVRDFEETEKIFIFRLNEMLEKSSSLCEIAERKTV